MSSVTRSTVACAPAGTLRRSSTAQPDSKKAKGKRQKAKGKREDALRAKSFPLLIFAFCLLPFTFPAAGDVNQHALPLLLRAARAAGADAGSAVPSAARRVGR